MFVFNIEFEGERVPNLTKIDSKTSTNQQDIQNNIDKEKDDYVLSKLFKKTGVHSALQHDNVVDHTVNDYVFIAFRHVRHQHTRKGMVLLRGHGRMSVLSTNPRYLE